MTSYPEHGAPALLRVLAPAVLRAADKAGIGVVVSSGEGALEQHDYVSDAAARMLGYAPHEASQPAEQHIADGHEGLAGTDLDQQGPRRAEVSLECSRAAVLAHVDVKTEVTAGHESTITVLFDSGDRYRAEQALQVSEGRFRQLIEAAPDAALIVTETGPVYANPSLLRLLGYESFQEFSRAGFHVHPDEAEGVLTRIKHAFESGWSTEQNEPSEVRWRHRDSHYVSVEVVAMMMEWDGQPAVLALGRDVSGRKRLQEQLGQADRLAAVGTLAAGVAHEINNPLAYVLLNLQYLLRELPKFENNPERLAQLSDRLAEARHGAERVSTIVRDLRAFSSTDQESRCAVDLKRVLISAIKVASTQLKSRARLVEDYPEQALFVYGNAARLEQVFLNLLTNAAQALPEDDSPSQEIRVSLRSEGTDRVVVEVADTGRGIPSDLLGRVFDPFFTTKPAGAGTGLGLPICHSIVTSLGGEITVASKLGEGTVFRVALPLSRDRAPAPSRSTTPPPGTMPARRNRVLVVDDELPVASMLGRVLADEHEVRIATTAREALDLLLKETFDVVLCDLLMPGMSGMDLHAELSSLRPGLEKRLVFMTGGAFTPRAADFLAEVPNHRIEKPFDLREIRRLVRAIAQQARRG